MATLDAKAEAIEYKIVVPGHGYGTWYLQDQHGRNVWFATICELNFCCGIFVIGGFSWSPKVKFEEVKQLIDAMKPYFRLALLTHNETTDGLKMIEIFKRLGAVELETVESNHINEGCGNIHLLMLHGTKPSINKPNMIPHVEVTSTDDYGWDEDDEPF